LGTRGEQVRRVESEWGESQCEWRWLEIRGFWRKARRVWSCACQLKRPRVKRKEEREKDWKKVKVRWRDGISVGVVWAGGETPGLSEER